PGIPYPHEEVQQECHRLQREDARDGTVQNETGRQLSWHRLRPGSTSRESRLQATLGAGRGPKNVGALSHVELVDNQLGKYVFLVQQLRSAFVLDRFFALAGMFTKRVGSLMDGGA
ncbi:unnamed protein product, partial [Ectocarpus sp. 12 AP-2014]